MKKSEIIRKVAKESGQSIEDTTVMFDSFVSIVGEVLRSDEKVTISGFGTFLPSSRKEKQAAHPQNPHQKITIPPHTVPRFKPSQQLSNKMKD
ncbi:HU family DNA-binding protein [Patescibacteria group bacterium]